MSQNKGAQSVSLKQSAMQMLKFLIFSLGAGIIQIVSYALLFELTHWDHWKCYLPSLVLSVLYNFTLNRRYTFKSANHVPTAMAKVAIYYLLFTPISTYLGNVAEEIVINNYVIEIVTMLSNFVTEFLICRFWVYRDSINTNDLAQKEKE